MTDLKTIDQAYTACAGKTREGWFGGVLVMAGRDKTFLSVPKDASYDDRAAHARSWAALTVNPRRELRLVLPEGEGVTTRVIAAAERVEGPVAPKENVATPTLAWIEKRAEQWYVMVYEADTIRTVFSRNRVMRCPCVAKGTDGLLFAFEHDLGPFATEVVVVDAAGVVRYRHAGREPVLCAADGGFVVGSEQATADRVTLRLDAVAKGRASATAELSEGDYLLNADVAWSGAAGCLYVVSESSPRYGYSNQIGLHRTIHVWQWQPGQTAIPMGQLPVQEVAFKSIGVENMTPIKPAVRLVDEEPVVFFKQHRFTGFRAFGWDLSVCYRGNDGWTEPVRVSESTMTSDSTFGLVVQGDAFIGLFPAQENEGGSGSKHCENIRVERVSFGREHQLKAFGVPEERRAEYRYPPACKHVAPEPPALTNPYEGRQLIWGDLHIHSIYSKCVAAVDGSPRENIRFARDVLGCRVFAIAEHTPHTTGIESTWLYDQLESTSGNDNVILYATEPGIEGTRHMNWYCRDRDVFEKLERIIIAQGRCYPEILRQIREDLPPDSVFVMRHVHGDAIPDEQIPQHVDPQFEVAMEAMQGRGNAMLGMVESSSPFPNSFLDAGCKIGLVGGTDHFREWAPNHFCLTGFWVKEVSQAGVWEAIRNRFTIAMSDSRVAMLTRCKGMPMGQTVTLAAEEPMRVTVQASCGHSIRRIALMRDGELLPWTEVNACTAEFELSDEEVTPGKHWYVVTAEVSTGHGEDNTGICDASPYFVWKR